MLFWYNGKLVNTNITKMARPERIELPYRCLEGTCVIHYATDGYLVRMVGFEPTRLTARNFKSRAATELRHIRIILLYFKFVSLSMVPQERFELSKAGLLRTVGVPISISHRGIFGATSRNRTWFHGSSGHRYDHIS